MTDIIPLPVKNPHIRTDPLETLRLAVTAIRAVSYANQQVSIAEGLDNPFAAGRIRGLDECLDLIAFFQDRSIP
jgi:hypothetical protein